MSTFKILATAALLTLSLANTAQAASFGPAAPAPFASVTLLGANPTIDIATRRFNQMIVSAPRVLWARW